MGDPPYPGAEAHHGLPWKYKDWFAERGINVNDPKYGAWVKGGKGKGNHQSWSKAYNDAWKEFKKKNPEATKKQIEKHYAKLRKDKQWGGGF